MVAIQGRHRLRPSGAEHVARESRCGEDAVAARLEFGAQLRNVVADD